MHLQWKRQTGDTVDCQGKSFKVTKGGGLASVDVLLSGYDIHFDNPKNCINCVMGSLLTTTLCVGWMS